MTYGGNFSRNTPLDDEPSAEDQDQAHELRALEAEQDAHEATLEAESDAEKVTRHSEFFPLMPLMRRRSRAAAMAAYPAFAR